MSKSVKRHENRYTFDNMSQILYTFCDMNNGYANALSEKIKASPPGTVFIYSDFAEIANQATIRQSLSRLAKEGQIRRIKPGIFEKPAFSTLLQENLPPDPDQIAKAIARNFHWTITPCGEHSLNILGLSTQVPAVWTYLSDGPYKEYSLGNTTLTFKHRTNRELSKMSYITSITVQALKTLGKEHVTDETIQILSSRIKAEDKPVILREAVDSSEWIYSTIQKICRN